MKKSDLINFINTNIQAPILLYTYEKLVGKPIRGHRLWDQTNTEILQILNEHFDDNLIGTMPNDQYKVIEILQADCYDTTEPEGETE